MEVEAYLHKSRLFRHLRTGPHGRLVERYAARLLEERLVRLGTWRCLNVVGGLLSWIASGRCALTDLDEHVVERYLRYRGGRQSIQPGDRAALKRWLSVLREEGSIGPAAASPLTPHERIFKEFEDYLRIERGLAPRSIIRHLPIIRRFLHEVCPAGDDDLGKISQDSVIGYIERHARDWSPKTGKAMCWSLRAFLRYLHHRKLNPRALAGCVPSIRRWKLATLPTYLTAAEVQKALDGCDRATAMGQRDYAILVILAKLGLRADETPHSPSMISIGVLARCASAPRAASGHGCRCHQTSVRPSSRICAMAAQSRRAGDYSSARSRPMSALHRAPRSPGSPRPLSIAPASELAHTVARISSGTALPPSFCALARP